MTAMQYMIAPQHLRMAMAVLGSTNYYDMRQIRKRHWINHAKLAGLGESSAAAILDEVLDTVPRVIEQAQNLLPNGFPDDLAESITCGLRDHAKLLAKT